MKIKITAETPEEAFELGYKDGRMEEEHSDVKELYFFGLKVVDLVKTQEIQGGKGSFVFLISRGNYLMKQLELEQLKFYLMQGPPKNIEPVTIEKEETKG